TGRVWEFAKEKGIATPAPATRGPLPGADPSADGTVVRRHPPRLPGTVVGVASERDILVIVGDPQGVARHQTDPRDFTDIGRPFQDRPKASDDLLALLDRHHVAGKQLHV